MAVKSENIPNPNYEVCDLEKDEDIRGDFVESEEDEDPWATLGVSKEILKHSKYSFKELSVIKEKLEDLPDEYVKLIESLTTAFKASRDLAAEQKGALALKKELESSNMYYEDLILKKEDLIKYGKSRPVWLSGRARDS